MRGLQDVSDGDPVNRQREVANVQQGWEGDAGHQACKCPLLVLCHEGVDRIDNSPDGSQQKRDIVEDAILPEVQVQFLVGRQGVSVP